MSNDLLEAATALIGSDHATGPHGPTQGGRVTDGVRRVVDLADSRGQVPRGRVRHVSHGKMKSKWAITKLTVA